jgi:hypothetical protein
MIQPISPLSSDLTASPSNEGDGDDLEVIDAEGKNGNILR